MEQTPQHQAMIKLKHTLICFGIVLLAGCSETPFYNKSLSIPSGSWKQQMRPTFKVKIDDVDATYDFILTVRTTTNYSYNNLWLYLNTSGPGKITGREPFEIKIANPDGSWTGEKSGSIVENRLLFKRRKLPNKGTYTFELEQGVTMTSLNDVIDVGLVIEKNK